MFADKIPPIKQNKKIIKIYNSTRYARLNWTHHLKPLIKKSYADFFQRLKENGYEDKPWFNCLSDSIEAGEDIKASKDIYGDSISIQYGHHPVPIAPTYTKGGGLRVLVEDGASLVFSLNVNGSVVAFICPQKSDISKTKKKYYMIGEWRNSADISASDIRKMLEFLFEIQTYCNIYCSGKISTWLLTKLNAKDESIRGGTNPMLRYFKYLGHLINGVRKLYGMGSPTP